MTRPEENLKITKITHKGVSLPHPPAIQCHKVPSGRFLGQHVVSEGGGMALAVRLGHGFKAGWG